MSVAPRSLLVFVLLIPLAILLGVMLATPLDSSSLLLVGSCFLLLLSPLMIRQHHTVMIVTWFAYLNVFFLPGQPYFWMLAAGMSFFFSILGKTLNRAKVEFYSVRSVAIPLIAFGILVAITAKLTGGVGSRALGSEVFGGKRYFYIWAAIIGYFAFSFQGILDEKRQKLSGWFFFSGTTAIIGNIVYWLGPTFYFLFILFPTDWVLQQVFTDQSVASGVSRISGLSPAMLAVSAFLLLRYGIKGMFRSPLLLFLYLGVGYVGLLGGFRSHAIILALMTGFQFFAEGLYKTKFLVPVMAGMVAVGVFTFAFSERFPLSIQRSLALFPVKVDPVARADAESSNQWRFDMWRVAVLDIPQYFWVGKGYSMNPTDLYLASESIKRGFLGAYGASLLAGDYHNGPLSLQLPLGVFGSLTFLWFVIASIRVLWNNLRYGEPSIQNINTFLFSYFLTRIVFFFVFFGSIAFDLMIFTGIVGLSCSLNRGMRTKGNSNREIARINTTFEERMPDSVPGPRLTHRATPNSQDLLAHSA